MRDVLTSEQARARLSPLKEGWLALACHHGHPFISQAASILMDNVPHDDRVSVWVRLALLRSAMARGDAEACRIFINDWSHCGGRPACRVSKFVPGQHYHCLGAKFDSLDQAVRHLEGRGYRYAGLDEKFVYPDGA